MRTLRPTMRTPRQPPAGRSALRATGGPLSQNPKKRRERRVFDAIYLKRAPFAVISSEHPDFLVRMAPELPLFGVEITEYFDSEVQARLRRISGYSLDLLDGRPFRHKEDRTELKVDKVSLIDGEGRVKQADFPAIIQQIPSLEICSSAVSEIIRTKDIKLDTVFAETEHVNLVIADQSGLLSRVESRTFYQAFCLDSLRRAVFTSRFREVYFVSTFKNKQVYIPLKLLLTLAQLFFFQAAVSRIQSGLGINTVEEFMRLFAAYLTNIAVGPVHMRSDPRGIEVMYGDSGFLLTEDLSVTIKMYNDWLWPTSAPIDSNAATRFDVTLLDTVLKFQRENTFRSEIMFPATEASGAGCGVSSL